MKTCERCEETKPLEAFEPRRAVCKTCRAKARREKAPSTREDYFEKLAAPDRIKADMDEFLERTTGGPRVGLKPIRSRMSGKCLQVFSKEALKRFS